MERVATSGLVKLPADRCEIGLFARTAWTVIEGCDVCAIADPTISGEVDQRKSSVVPACLGRGRRVLSCSADTQEKKTQYRRDGPSVAWRRWVSQFAICACSRMPWIVCPSLRVRLARNVRVSGSPTQGLARRPSMPHSLAGR